MTTLDYTRPNRLDQLCDELVTALPQLGAGKVAPLILLGDGDAITVTYPDDLAVDQASVDGVVNAHVPKPDPRPVNRQTMADRATQAVTSLVAAADALDAGTATAAQQRAALSLCCRNTARLVRLLLNELDQAT